MRKGRLIFPFSLRTDCTFMSPGPDELAPRHRWARLISHTDSARVRRDAAALRVQCAISLNCWAFVLRWSFG